MTYETTICRDDIEIEVEVEFNIYAARRGARDRYGAQMEPDEDESIEIVSVTDPSGAEIELTKQEEERIEEKCIEHAEDSRY